MSKAEIYRQLLLDVAEFNDKKYGILKNMAKLELTENIGKEYSDLADSYEIVNWYLNKKLSEADILDKSVVSGSLIINNPQIFNVDNFMDIIKNTDQMLPLRKVICDLGGKSISFYDYNTEIENVECNHRFNKMMKNLTNSSEIKLRCDTINAYLVYDFINMMFSIILDDMKNVKVDKVKTILIALKYNLIYLSNDLENMAIKNKFKFSNNVELMDEQTIKKIGITKNDYLETLNYVFCGLLEDSICDAVDRVHQDALPCLEYSDYILIKTAANLITNKKECDDLLLEPTDKMLPNVKKANMVINKVLIDSKKVDSYTRKKIK